MKILGYSERGIINSLIFNIGEDKELLNKFIESIKLRNPFELGEPKDYTILLEQSFSRFGDSDLIIIIDYEKPENKKVLFFEGKVKTYKRNWNIQTQFNKYKKQEKYNGSSSNLFFQLHLKKLLIENLVEIKEKGGIREPKFGDFRKKGSNKIVLDAFDLIADSEAYYIGLIPISQKKIDEFIEENKDLGLHFISWETVYDFCQCNNLEKVKEIFKYNEGQIY